MASRGQVDFWLLLAAVSGISLVIASACVFNNIIDQDIDSKMARTKGRAMASGLLPGKNALIYGSLVGLGGFFILAIYINLLTLAIGLGAWLSYVVLYGWAKRRTVHGTLVGTIPGAAPVVAGYTAVTGQLDNATLILFFTLVFWQMAHFYSIALYRLDDYRSAGIPVLPAEKGERITKVYIVVYIVAFIVAVLMLSLLDYSGSLFAAAMGAFGAVWLYLGLRGFSVTSDKVWARQMFKFSLVVILAFSLMLAVGR